MAAGGAARAAPARARSIRVGRIARLAPLGLLSLGLFLVAIVLCYQWVYRDRIPLGVRVGGVDVGGLRPEDARLLIGRHLAGYAQSPLVLRYGSQEWRLTPAELGLSLESDAAIVRGLALRQEGPVGAGFAGQVEALSGKSSFDWSVAVDDRKEQAALGRLAAALDRPAVDAQVDLQGEAVLIRPEQPGRRLDRDALGRRLRDRYAARSSSPIDLPVVDVAPALRAAAIQPARARLDRILNTPMRLRAVETVWDWRDGPVAQQKERTWTLGRPELAGLLVVRKALAPDDSAIVADLDPARAGAFAERLAKEVNQAPRDARFDWNNGNPRPIVTSQHRRTLEAEELVRRMRAAVSSGISLVELPIRDEKPAVAMEDLPKMGLREKLVERSTDYSGSVPERVHNVELGARRLHGVVVPPGGTFSFNEAVGEVSDKSGYQLGFAIVAGSTVPDPGGGICQVSTTVFQASFFGGYEITERHHHAYRMRRYEPPAGLDATVYDPQLDFKFRNTGGSSLLIQTRVERNRLHVALYGTRPGWEVRVDEPKLSNVQPADRRVIRQYSKELAKGREVWVETAEDGVDVSITRTVRHDGRVLDRLTLTSKYRPERNVLLIGTGGEPR